MSRAARLENRRPRLALEHISISGATGTENKQPVPPEEISLGGLPLGPRCPEPIRPPLVSFVLRNWNYADFIGSAINSIKQQNYPRFEVIVVDNGSTDGSRDIIAEHIEDDARFLGHTP